MNSLMREIVVTQISGNTNNNSKPLKEKDIEKVINNSIEFYCLVTKNDKTTIRDELYNKIKDVILMETNIIAQKGFVIEGINSNFVNKIEIKENGEQWKRFKSYKNILNYLPELVVEAIDYDTNQIVMKIPCPTTNDKFECIGLVVGNVQSGKTTNMIGVANKALDKGYDIVIVTAGSAESLRNQIQKRFEFGLVGQDSATDEIIGIGKYLYIEDESEFKRLKVGTHQTVINDSNKKVNGEINEEVFKYLKYETGNKYVFICKRNSTAIDKLIRWAKKQKDKIDNASVLFIADESDQALINTEPLNKKPSTINRSSRELFKLFKKRTHISYTATPFSDIFIPEPTEKNKEEYGTDFYPKDFIYVLKPPSNYLGPTEFFGDINQQPFVKLVEEIDGYDKEVGDIDKNNDEQFILPESLKVAIINFILVGAIRDLRGFGESHNTMLININPYRDDHNKIKKAVSIYMEELRNDVINNKADCFWENIFKIWDEILINTPRIEEIDKKKELKNNYKLDFEKKEIISKVKKYLLEQSNSEYKIKIKEINSRAKEELDYHNFKNGLHVIAIGGYTLSRGLTLEGLTISYYLRQSLQADTQLQSCRWFGYRANDCRDLVRLYTEQTINEILIRCTDITKSLLLQFEHMSMQGKTPDDVGYFIKKFDKEKVRPTSSNKMRSAKVIIDVEEKDRFAGQDFDISTFYFNDKFNIDNKKILEDMINKIGIYDEERGAYIWRGVDRSTISDFIKNIKAPDEARINKRGGTDAIAEYVRSDKRIDGVTVALFNNTKRGKKIDEYYVGNYSIVPVYRNADILDANGNVYEVNRGRALTNRHLRFAFTDDQLKSIEKEFPEDTGFDKSKVPGAKIIISKLKEIKTAYLLIYIYDKETINKSLQKQGKEIKLNENPIAMYLALPGETVDNRIAKYVNWRYTYEDRRIILDEGI